MTRARAAGGNGRRIRGLDAGERRAQRRRQLLETALDLFARQGYPNTSIEQLCQSAYVGTKGFYEIFDGREDCYIALFRQVSDQVKGEVSACLAAGPPDVERALIATFAHGFVDDPRRALVTFGQAGAVSEAIERERRANRRWAAEFVDALWRDQGVGGRPRVAVGLVGALFELIADWLVDADPGDPVQVESLIADLNGFYDVVRAGLRG